MRVHEANDCLQGNFTGPISLCMRMPLRNLWICMKYLRTLIG